MNHELSHYPHRKTTYPEIGTPEIRRQIGKELKSAREFQEMSLEQVMAITKINLRFLEFIDEGKWNFLPPTYVKAFIRAYSASVGLQADKLSNRLDELFAGSVVASAPVNTYLMEGDESGPPQPIKVGGFWIWAEKHRALLFYGIIGIIVAVLVVLYLWKQSENSQTVNTEQPDTTTIVKTVPVAPKVVAPDTVKTALPKPDSASVKKDSLNADAKLAISGSIVLRIRTRDTCYVKIEHGESIIYEKTLWPGNDLDLAVPHPIRLTLDNAPAADISVDGRQLPALPSSHRVQIIKLGPEGIIG
jgi:cytoskeletal protein RodZ